MESYFVSLYKHSRKTKIGVRFSRDNDGFISIHYIRPGSIFEETELDVGDVVYEINGIPVDGMSAEDAARTIQNAKKVITLRGDKRKPEAKEIGTSSRSLRFTQRCQLENNERDQPSPKLAPMSRRRKVLPNNKYAEEHVYIYQEKSDGGRQSFECFHQENMTQVDSSLRSFC